MLRAHRYPDRWMDPEVLLLAGRGSTDDVLVKTERRDRIIHTERSADEIDSICEDYTAHDGVSISMSNS